jgi:1,4-alpha-glucan branching enzyme
MPVNVSFVFRPGIPADAFSEVRLCGYWDANGAPAATPTPVRMDAVLDEAGCPAFQTRASLPSESIGRAFRWGVRAETRDGADRWLIVAGSNQDGQVFRQFTLGTDGQTESYDLTFCRRLGANMIKSSASGSRGCRFQVWAPNARAVELTLANPSIGYVASDGSGAVQSIAMTRDKNGIWSTGDDLELADAARTHGKPYMYRIIKDDGSIAYRTDLFSRAQIGRGWFDPDGKPYRGLPSHLDGTKSCSLVCDPDRIVDDQGDLIAQEDFWADEFDPAKPLPTNTQDLVIYELHVGALGFGRPDSGTLNDAIAFIDHLAALGVNAVELLPVSEFQGEVGWGYSTSHYCAIEGSIGGADRLKHFVRACHKRGIAVLLDVVYNHYDGDAERAEWQFDSNAFERNIYYWYEGKPSDYSFPEGGYIDNESTGWAPRFDEEMVRQLFISSAAAFVTDFHVDGFRVDQTTSIHAYAKLHANGQPADRARAAGVAFLRQWTQTLRLIRPGLFLTAEDHSGWENVTKPYDQGGLGFDAAWYSDFYHHLVDFGEGGANWAKLLRNAGYGDNRPLAMSFFAGAMRASGSGKVVYNDTHDEAGNSPGSARTICLAVNNAPLIGATRIWAEARVRVAAGLALLSAGTPMFFMGEEVGAQEPYRYNDFLQHREDLVGLSSGIGRFLFAYYRDLIALSRGTPAIRSRNVDAFLADDANRLIAFRRWDERDELLVVASFNPQAFDHGYRMSHPRFAAKSWREIFNSDAKAYGGTGLGNEAALTADGSTLNPIVPASGLIVLRAQQT